MQSRQQQNFKREASLYGDETDEHPRNNNSNGRGRGHSMSNHTRGRGISSGHRGSAVRVISHTEASGQWAPRTDRFILHNQEENEMYEKYSLNQRLYYNMLELFEQRNKILMQKYQGHFVEDVLRHAQSSLTNYNIVKESKVLFLKDQKNLSPTSLNDYQKDAYPPRQPDYSEELFFFGYPQGNFLKQICVVLMLWQIKGRFPVRFQEIESLQDHDETAYYVQSTLSQLTTLVNQIFKEIDMIENDNCSPRVLQKFILEFLCTIEPRGFLTMLGIRKTVGGQDSMLIPERADLEYMYNRLNRPLSKEEFANNPNPSVLTVGARALMKHVGRKKAEHQQCYWVSKKENLQDLTEREKNARADRLIGRIISTAQWINVHTLCQSNPTFILELRDSSGHGARWEIDNQFRGLVEPQLKYK